MQTAYNQFGRDYFSDSILEDCVIEMLNDRELAWMKCYDGKLFNMRFGKFGRRRRTESDVVLVDLRTLLYKKKLWWFDLKVHLGISWQRLDNWVYGVARPSKEMKNKAAEFLGAKDVDFLFEKKKKEL